MFLLLSLSASSNFSSAPTHLLPFPSHIFPPLLSSAPTNLLPLPPSHLFRPLSPPHLLLFSLFLISFHFCSPPPTSLPSSSYFAFLILSFLSSFVLCFLPSYCAFYLFYAYGFNLVSFVFPLIFSKLCCRMERSEPELKNARKGKLDRLFCPSCTWSTHREPAWSPLQICDQLPKRY